jgi:hypothetical protein
LYKPYLAQHGVELDLAPLIDNARFERIANGERLGLSDAVHSYVTRAKALWRSGGYDLLWVHYELFPYLPGLAERLGFLRGKPVVFDFDDAIFHMYDTHPNRLVRTILGKKLLPLLRKAEVAICGNAYLEGYARRYCSRTVVIPTVVDTDVLRPISKPVRKGPLTLGWMGSPSTWRDVEPLLPAILPKLTAHDAELLVVGGGPRSRGIQGIRALDWSEATEVRDLHAMEVGIMPVSDQPFQRGKCGYKLIQYMACGLPVIASPVGVNTEIAGDTGAGLLADTPDEWVAAIDRLLTDPALRDHMGKAGREAAVERYSLRSQEPRLLETLFSAVSRR